MGQEAGDHSLQNPVAQKNESAATALSQQVNLLDRMHLKDPGKQSSVELLQNDYLTVTPIAQASSMNDPHKFLAVASKMADSAPGGNLTFSLLDQVQASPTAGADEKAVAKTLQQDYPELATDDPHSWKRFMRFTGFPIGRAVREEGLTELKGEQYAADALARHPEINSPQALAYAFAGVFEKKSPFEQSIGFSRGELSDIAASSEYTDQQRAAAELVKANFDKFSTLGDKDGSMFNIHDVAGLAKIGLPPGTVLPGETCDRSSPAANAAGYAIAVGLISAALGSKQSMANAAVAGASAAVATEVKNNIQCGAN